MTSPPEDIEVECPECAAIYTDWYRPSINRSLGEEFDEEYFDAASSAVCPRCGFKVYFETLDVISDIDGNAVMRFGRRGAAQ